MTRSEKGRISTYGFGHMADGDIHINICVEGDRELSQRLNNLVDPFVMDFIRQRQGSISGEHGIGQQKANYMPFAKSPEMLRTMQLVKDTLDPNGIMNPYKVLPKRNTH